MLYTGIIVREMSNEFWSVLCDDAGPSLVFL